MAYLNVCPACGAQNRVPARHLPDTGRCGPCRAAAPEVRELAKEMAGKALVLKVDTEAQPTLAGLYGIQSIPNFMIFLEWSARVSASGARAARHDEALA